MYSLRISQFALENHNFSRGETAINIDGYKQSIFHNMFNDQAENRNRLLKPCRNFVTASTGRREERDRLETNDLDT